jgi:N utilization substance protein B
MNRKTAREIAMKLIYELDFNPERADEVIDFRMSEDGFRLLSGEDKSYDKPPEENQREYILKIVRGVFEHLPEIDEYIEKYSIGWKFKRISRVSAAILRVCMFELLYMPDIPESSSINEAVELAKKFDADEAPAFINGVLGSFTRAERSGL